MRISDLCALAALAGLNACSDPPAQGQAEPGAQAIDCIVSGSPAAQRCMVERRANSDGKLLIVRHPDGGFRRFRQAADGAGLVALDGADAVSQQFGGGVLTLSVAGDRYDFPADARVEHDADKR